MNTAGDRRDACPTDNRCHPCAYKGNPYLPHLATLTHVREEGPGLMTFEAEFQDPEVREHQRRPAAGL